MQILVRIIDFTEKKANFFFFVYLQFVCLLLPYGEIKIFKNEKTWKIMHA